MDPDTIDLTLRSATSLRRGALRCLGAALLATGLASGVTAQNVTPDVIYGSGNANGEFTITQASGVELGLRAKLRFNSMGFAENTFNSNGDGTYTYNTGSGGSVFPNAEWGFDFHVNTDWDGSTGLTLDDLTYEIGFDFDPGAGTDFLSFDPIIQAYADHSTGDNSTANGGGVEAPSGDSVAYAGLLASQNVAQNSWRMTFFDDPPFSFDPNVPGRYDFYLAAFDGSGEVARVEMTVLAVDGATLSLEADPCQTDQDGVLPGAQVNYELWLRNPDDQDVTGFQAFLEYDDIGMTFEPTASVYTSTPFALHIQAMALAEVLPGRLRLDGSSATAVGTTGDALLATLVFTVPECTPVSIAFDGNPPFDSELSYFGLPLVTSLLDSDDVLPDATAPVLAGTPGDITQPSDAGSCLGAVVTWTDPTATDNCDPSPVVACDPPSGSFFDVGTTTVTCTATDACGNVATETFDVTITATNLVDVVVQLPGSDPTTRCIRFVTDCGSTADATLTFVGSPATATATIEVPCGSWTKLCAKDQQHTLWDDSPLVLSGTKYVATGTMVLEGGDTDDDGDVDINDVTLFLAQFGDLASAGGCPWDGVTRDTDFSNNGAVGSEDYVFLAANWLQTSGCSCPLMKSGRRGPQIAVRAVSPIEQAVDLNRDGFVDVRDVEIFESLHGLSGALSARMRE